MNTDINVRLATINDPEHSEIIDEAIETIKFLRFANLALADKLRDTESKLLSLQSR